MHISELAQQHVENPREIVAPGDSVRVKILEIDSERRRLSLSIKRVEDQVLPRRTVQPAADSEGGAGDLDNVPELGLSEDVFAAEPAAEAEAPASRSTAAGRAEVVGGRRRRARARPPRPRPRGRASPRRCVEPREPAEAEPAPEPGEEQA